MRFNTILLCLLFVGCGRYHDGANGNVGPSGPQGSPGQSITGTSGSNGSSCSTSTVSANDAAPNGGALISCTDGSSSLLLNGTNGSDGTAGTLVTAIQFCGSVTGSYPSTFPEIGFCINNNIYAVFSTNGGFLTEVLPGTWSSDGINASCTFTVSAGCVVNDN